MGKTVVLGDFADALDGVLTLRGGTAAHLDTIYALDLPAVLPPDHPVKTTTVLIIDGPGDALVELSKGDDELELGPGADWAKAGCGDDTVMAGPGEDAIMGGCGSDAIDLGTGDDFARGGWGDDLITGGAGADSIYGDDGDDLLYGGDGRDDLHGGRGEDVLVGGPGHDVLIGGHGADLFRVNALDLDQVLDFNAAEGDRLIVDRVDVTDDAAAWIGQDGTVAPPGEAAAVPASDGATG